MSGKIEVYGDSISGNCYKIQLTCAQLGIEHVWHELDLMQGAARTDEFRAMNPNGKVPLLKLADGRYLGSPPEEQANLESKRPGGYKALKVMDGHLASNDFFANGSYSIADIALYAYTHVAEEGGFDLGKYTNIKAWFRRVESQPGFIAMKA